MLGVLFCPYAMLICSWFLSPGFGLRLILSRLHHLDTWSSGQAALRLLRFCVQLLQHKRLHAQTAETVFLGGPLRRKDK